MKKSEATRLTILQKAFELIYVKGFQTTSIDEIIATTQVTKGAFYYHFKTKDEMGLAIITDLMKPNFKKTFIDSLQNSKNPLDSIYDIMYHLLMENDFLKVEYGCPTSNFIQQMAPWHTAFTQALHDLSKEWELALAESIEKGKESGIIKKEVSAKEVSVFVISGYWGVRNLGKLENSKEVYLTYLKGLKSYFKTLQ
ncbi:Toluene efflux pump ttgABC operon repressor [Chryseobacterium gleum]|uniref:Toluene efflux pump ttgABC operon repressor n=2 Tax=Chryseobacterium gleum TaxID=250 RepID=A0A448AXR6_CHRGE|nr:TetR/AcrR family transcriptional regulator [Chryseobacterium gleum]EFK34763.1 transcriptional regulator, TetR family [Chryseobacterium gleum ATCC 35910]QQY30588.1 TetR/AcrR family transcriptional regulator [Chryseobacterium gleum]VEE05068.1 Toluene efflux pump ttgABC operon repressor [Chryseobacterium gleum]